MAKPAPLYDLVVLLDSEVTESQATTVLGNAEKIITGGSGEIVSDQDWGLRALSYEIRHKSAAQYHLMQFHAPREVLEQLDRMLHIADGVVRYRIIKLRAGTPDPPDLKASAVVTGGDPDPAEARGA